MQTWRPHTLAEAARRVRTGEDPFEHAVSEFLDTFYVWLREGKRAQAQASIALDVGEVPDTIQHALFGAIGEHLALRWGLDVPAWTACPSRFLKRPYFTTPLESLKALCLAESPTAFRRRMIFTEAEPLRRARFPRSADGDALDASAIKEGTPIPSPRDLIRARRARSSAML